MRDRHHAAWVARDLRRAPRPPALASTEHSRARLSFVLLVYFVAIVAMIQLAPFGFLLPRDIRLVASTGWQDMLVALLLFIPLGFLYPLSRMRERSSRMHVALWATLIATLIAVGRIFELDRDVALLDIAASAAGAALGATLLGMVNARTRRSTRLAGRLSLEIPLVGLLYLLLPLVVATSLSAVDDVRGMLILLPLGLLAALLLAGIQEHHFGPARVFSPRGMALIAAGWTALGIFPAAFRHPFLSAGVVVVVAGATLYGASRPALHGGEERRFEADILRSATPYVVVYFLGVVGLPLAAGIGHWHVALGLTGAAGDFARQIVHLLEPLTSLVLLGYLLAEARGRRELVFGRVALRVALECAVVAAVMEASRGFQPEAGASVLEFVLLVFAAVLGAGMYHHQRERVRWMLIHRVAPADAKRRAEGLVRIA